MHTAHAPIGVGLVTGGSFFLDTPLRRRREAAGLSQQDVADLAGVSIAQVVRLEHGRTGRWGPAWTTVQKLSHALDAEPAAMFPEFVIPSPENSEARPAPDSATTTVKGPHRVKPD